jgi:hypothetical protein
LTSASPSRQPAGPHTDTALHAVVGTWNPTSTPPWEVDMLPPDGFTRLHGGMADAQVGAVVYVLAAYNNVSVGDDACGAVRAIVDAPILKLPGGLAVRRGGLSIAPSCCTGLEDWRDWESLVPDRLSPWMGHDPAPWLQWREGVIRVWSDGGLDVSVPDAEWMEFPADDFPRLMEDVRRDLREFLPRLREWARAHCPEHADALAERFDATFNVTRREV